MNCFLLVEASGSTSTAFPLPLDFFGVTFAFDFLVGVIVGEGDSTRCFLLTGGIMIKLRRDLVEFKQEVYHQLLSKTKMSIIDTSSWHEM